MIIIYSVAEGGELVIYLLRPEQNIKKNDGLILMASQNWSFKKPWYIWLEWYASISERLHGV